MPQVTMCILEITFLKTTEYSYLYK